MSQTTKRALEASLKNMLLKKPLNKITINDIAEDCGVNVVPQIKRNSILHIIRDCFCDVSMNNSRLFDADSALYFI